MATAPCLLAAWTGHADELRGFLRHHCPQADDADDLLHDIFIKAVQQGEAFCRIGQPRAWLFQVARNALADRFRRRREEIALPEDLPQPPADDPAPVESLSQCLPGVLAELSAEDRLAISFCDIEGHSQQELAERLGLSLPGAKSRVQRARERLRRRLIAACQVRFDENGQVCCFTPRPPG